MGYKQPESYWEKRTAISEEMLDSALMKIACHLPTLYEDLRKLNWEWHAAVEKIKDEL